MSYLNEEQSHALYELRARRPDLREAPLRVIELPRWRRRITLGTITFEMDSEGWVGPATTPIPDETDGLLEITTA